MILYVCDSMAHVSSGSGAGDEAMELQTLRISVFCVSVHPLSIAALDAWNVARSAPYTLYSSTFALWLSYGSSTCY